MAFNDLQMKAASEYAVFAAHKNLAKISQFSHTFTELNGRPGESIAVPIYDLSAGAAFTAGTNDYGTGGQEIGGVLVELDKHFVKSVSITDKDLAYTGINWVKDTTAALAERITRDINGEVFKLINSSNCSISAVASTYIGSTPSKTTVAGLYSLAETKDLPVDKCVLVLNPTYFARVLGLVDYNMIGSGDYIKTGVIEGLFGFKAVVCNSNWATETVSSQTLCGAIVLDEAIGVASKYLAPMTPGAYPEAWSATSDEGFTVGFRRFMDLNTGSDKFSVDALFGCKLLQPTKVIRLVNG